MPLRWQWKYYQHAEALTEFGTYQVLLDTGDLWLVFLKSEIVGEGIPDLKKAVSLAETHFLETSKH